jgi:hypothetical protein
MLTFRIQDAGKLTDHLKKTIHTAAMQGVVSAAFRIVGIIQNEIIPEEKPQPVDQGAYRAGWIVGYTAKGADVYNVAPHAPIIEFGARASNIKIGRAMIEALSEWVVRKGLVAKSAGNIQASALENEAQRAAWAIAMSMKKRGIFNREGNAGLGVLKKAKLRIPAVLAEEVAAEIREALGSR